MGISKYHILSLWPPFLSYELSTGYIRAIKTLQLDLGHKKNSTWNQRACSFWDLNSPVLYLHCSKLPSVSPQDSQFYAMCSSNLHPPSHVPSVFMVTNDQTPRTLKERCLPLSFLHLPGHKRTGHVSWKSMKYVFFNNPGLWVDIGRTDKLSFFIEIRSKKL